MQRAPALEDNARVKSVMLLSYTVSQPGNKICRGAARVRVGSIENPMRHRDRKILITCLPGKKVCKNGESRARPRAVSVIYYTIPSRPSRRVHHIGRRYNERSFAKESNNADQLLESCLRYPFQLVNNEIPENVETRYSTRC